LATSSPDAPDVVAPSTSRSWFSGWFARKPQALAPGFYAIKDLDGVKLALRAAGEPVIEGCDITDLILGDVTDLIFKAADIQGGMVEFELSGSLRGQEVPAGT
jgi:hypothetical protein